MKILLSIPGHLKTVPMNDYIYLTLKNMGHNVIIFNYGSHGLYPRLLKKLSRASFLDYIDRKLIRSVNKFKPDIFLTVFGFDHRKTILKKIKFKGVATICWWLNDPFQIKRSMKQASFYDYYFTNSKGSLKEYQKADIKNVFYLPVGSFPEVHRKFNKMTDVHDISFAGDWSPAREKILFELAKDFNISIFGPWKKKLNKNSPLNKYILQNGFFSADEMVNIFNSSKVVLNIHTWFGQWDHGLNPRVFEANGCGAFQISDYKEEISELYEPDKEIVLYKDITELKEKLSYFLKHPKNSSYIAEMGLMRTLKEHTYEQRLNEMFNIVDLK